MAACFVIQHQADQMVTGCMKVLGELDHQTEKTNPGTLGCLFVQCLFSSRAAEHPVVLAAAPLASHKQEVDCLEDWSVEIHVDQAADH